VGETFSYLTAFLFDTRLPKHVASYEKLKVLAHAQKNFPPLLILILTPPLYSLLTKIGTLGGHSGGDLVARRSGSLKKNLANFFSEFVLTFFQYLLLDFFLSQYFKIFFLFHLPR
jgi:hypothetical protein